jgi:hypothetical protein
MKNFKQLPSNPCNDGIQYIYKAENGYGASIVRHQWSYGGKQGLWEVAVLGPDGDICYSTPITSDVVGHLTDKEVNKLLEQIDAL